MKICKENFISHLYLVVSIYPSLINLVAYSAHLFRVVSCFRFIEFKLAIEWKCVTEKHFRLEACVPPAHRLKLDTVLHVSGL